MEQYAEPHTINYNLPTAKLLTTEFTRLTQKLTMMKKCKKMLFVYNYDKNQHEEKLQEIHQNLFSTVE